MLSPQDQAIEHAERYVRDRGGEPLAWEEVRELLDWAEEGSENLFDIDEICHRIAGVTMSKTARRALADAFEVDSSDLTPRAVA